MMEEKVTIEGDSMIEEKVTIEGESMRGGKVYHGERYPNAE